MLIFVQIKTQIQTAKRHQKKQIMEQKELNLEAQKAVTKTSLPAKQNERAAALRDIQNQTTNAVLEHIHTLQEAGDLMLPENYAVGNQIKMAWLKIIDVKDRAGKPALEICTKESIANAVLEMCVQGLSVTKKQGDFIVYGDKLTFALEYHGTIALARRLGGVVGVPTGNVIYEGDTFEYQILPESGKKKVTRHDQKLENIDNNKIIGAYATLQLEDGTTHTEIMPIAQIRQSWMQGATKGQSPAHKNFPDQMAIKTVIGRACKLFITSSDDSGLYTAKSKDEMDDPNNAPPVSRPKPERKILDIEEAEMIEMAEEPMQKPKAVEAERPKAVTSELPNF